MFNNFFHSDASVYLTTVLTKVKEEEEQEKWLDKIIEVVQRQSCKYNGIRFLMATSQKWINYLAVSFLSGFVSVFLFYIFLILFLHFLYLLSAGSLSYILFNYDAFRANAPHQTLSQQIKYGKSKREKSVVYFILD